MPRTRPAPTVALALLLLATSHCGSAAFIRAAESGRTAEVRTAVAAEIARGSFSDGDAVALARSLAQREVERADGEPGMKRIQEVQSCARQLGKALERRSEQRDAVGAAAAITRVDAGLDDPDDYEEWMRVPAGGPHAAWRALGARAMNTEDHGAWRRHLFLDADQEVRHMAFRASVDAADPTDVEGLLEAARVDPHPPARIAAIRAAGLLGGERVVLALKDLWAQAEEPARAAIAGAWSMPASLDEGGRRELVWAADTQRGGAATAAALALLRVGGEGTPSAIGVLERAIKEGSTRERIHAIDTAPLSVPSLREAIVKAGSDPDEAVAVEAMARRLEADPGQGGAPPGDRARPAIIAKLVTLAQGTGASALAAKGVLARAGAKEVRPILDKDAGSTDLQARAVAGTALAVLGDLRRAAVVAADDDPYVRTVVSCAILRAAK